MTCYSMVFPPKDGEAWDRMVVAIAKRERPDFNWASLSEELFLRARAAAYCIAIGLGGAIWLDGIAAYISAAVVILGAIGVVRNIRFSLLAQQGADA